MERSDQRKEPSVAKYLWKVQYTQDGAKGLLKDGGTARVTMLEKLLADMGGTLESFYFAVGEDGAYIVVDLPSNADAVAVSMTVAAGGGATSVTVPLLTPEEVDGIADKTVQYRAPGQ